MNLETITRNAAKSDMKVARKRGEMAIAGTKVGTVFVAYDTAAKLYTVTPAGLGTVGVTLKAKECETHLAALYVVDMG